MKRCPQCNREFDDEFRFCLEDGTALFGEGTAPTVAAPTMVLPTPEQTPPTIPQAARPDVPAPPNLAATRMPADNGVAGVADSGGSRTVIIVGIVLVLGLLFSLVGVGLTGIFYVRRIPMILLC